MTTAFIVVSVLTVAFSFTLLSRVLRDPRLQTSAPGLTGLAGKIIVTAILVSHLGLLCWPELNTMFWLISDLGLAFGLFLLTFSFYDYHRRVKFSTRKDVHVAVAHYTEVSEGIVARSYNYGEPAMFSFEIPMVKWLEEQDFPSGATILFHQSRRGCDFGDATKNVDELLYVLRGQARLSDTVSVGAGEQHFNPAHWEHYYLAEDHTIGCSVIWPE